MTIIKGVNRSACVAFAPDAPYLAAGTMAGAVDLQFSSSANIDIFELDFASDDRQLILAGTVPSSERFNRLSWGKPLPNSEEFSLGLVAGGLVDGNIGLWNPKPLISAHQSKKSPELVEGAFIQNLSRHRGPVRGLEFNAYSPNLLASGADEGEICIWDVANPTEPTHFPPLKGSGSSTQGEISFLSWNAKAQHILASTSYNGTTVVWDLKKQKPVMSFPDPVGRRCSVLQWNPELATQLVVASDEDSSPSLRLWDLRNVMAPVKEFVGHTKGVIAMSWCPIDSSYVLTCAKDNRTICWDVTSGEIVAELPAGTNWNFDVHWYPRIPGVISASSYDGKIGIYNIEGCGRYGREGDVSPASFRAPKWYKRKAGVSFGFGGKLVSFKSSEASVGSSEVYVHNLVTEHSLVTRSSDFEAAIQNGEKSSWRLLCEKKSQESQSEDEKEIWAFLKVMFDEDGTARTKLLSHLGFNPPSGENYSAENGISDQVNALDLNEGVAAGDEFAASKETVMYAFDNGEDFFNNLPSPKAETPVSASGSKPTAVDFVPVEEDASQQELEGDVDPTEASFDDAVQRALVVGDYKGAVAQCISANRMADALVIAHAGDALLWESTRDQYLKASRSPYLKVVAAMVNHDLMSLVNTRPLKAWKETIALLCTFAAQEEWTLLCDTLASRLMAAGNTLAATLCFICAGNIDKTVEIWSRNLAGEHDGKPYVELFQDLMEKTIVLAVASGQKKSASLFKLIEKYAEILASQGLLSTAMEYLKLLGTEELSPELTVLHDRIARSMEEDKVTPNSTSIDPHPENPYPQPRTGLPNNSYRYMPPVPSPSPYTPPVPSPAPYTPPVPSPTPYSNAGLPAHLPNIPPTNIFVPSHPPPNTPGNFPSTPATNQQPVTTFVPSAGRKLANVEKYQQPTTQPTLGSQLYPAANNANYHASPYGAGSFVPNTVQTGPPAMQSIPPVAAPSSTSGGFMPTNNPGVPRSAVSGFQPSSPTQAAPIQPPATPAPPPPTVQTADTSNVPAQQKPVITTLTRLFHETSEALGGSRAIPAKRKEIDDNSRKLGVLFVKLNSGDISKRAAEKLTLICQALDNSDFATALKLQVELTGTDWDECNFWLMALKRMIKTRQTMRL
ncbi:OLC1v1001324C2 [Oldenlandia corymbosa var. corymbosa]|uniref:OLC1v1001324C2 n=1 Tax=Oldenlandia corymbosa var. corymbosa TaxID=529605 RepID=A0AAV1D4X5_OLDCO|nr:OLC1v1001324C2 [Oldenlandia corymbosa var. corymbosa]